MAKAEEDMVRKSDHLAGIWAPAPPAYLPPPMCPEEVELYACVEWGNTLSADEAWLAANGY